MRYVLPLIQRYRFLITLYYNLPSQSPLDKKWPRCSKLFRKTSILLRNMYHAWRVRANISQTMCLNIWVYHHSLCLSLPLSPLSLSPASIPLTLPTYRTPSLPLLLPPYTPLPSHPPNTPLPLLLPPPLPPYLAPTSIPLTLRTYPTPSLSPSPSPTLTPSLYTPLPSHPP